MTPGKLLIVLGLALTAAGVLLTLGPKLPFRLGQLPGDLLLQGKGSSFYFPITTCIVLSVILTLVMRALRK